MSLQDFQTSKCSHHVHIPFSLCWSEDNMLAMATDKGVYVSVITPYMFNKSCSVKTKRYFIEPKTDLPTADCGVSLTEQPGYLPPTILGDVMQDLTMFPTLRASNHGPFVKQLCWSPLINKVPYKSLLTILTDAGSLELYILKKSSWISVASVSEVWLDHLLEGWPKVGPRMEMGSLLSILKQRSYKIKLTSFVWGSMLEEEGEVWFSFFTSNLLGEVSVWKICSSKDPDEIEVELLDTISTDLGHIVTIFHIHLEYNRSLLIISSEDGRIQALPISFEKQSLVMGKFSNLWNERDKIQPRPNGGISCLWDKTVVFVIVKGAHVFIFHLNCDGTIINRCLHDSEDLTISGLSKLSENEILFTTRSGNIWHLGLSDSGAQFSPAVTKLQNSLRSDQYACNGIALSKNKVMATLSFTVYKNFDQLSVREPTQIVWCSLPGLRDVTELINSAPGTLSDIWDVIDMLRIDCIQKNESIEYPSKMELDFLEIDKLKKYFWLIQISLMVQTNAQAVEKMRSIKIEIMILIMSVNIFKNIADLLPKSKSLTEFEKRCLIVMRDWIKYSLSKLDDNYEATKATANTLLQQIIEDATVTDQETCIICDSMIPEFNDAMRATCEAGHKIPRCSVSLVQVDIFPYYFCPQCESIAHPNAVAELCPSCIYCDVTFQKDETIIKDK